MTGNGLSRTNKIRGYATYAAFPTAGQTGVWYFDLSTGTPYIWDGTAYQDVDPVADDIWEKAAGVITAQVDGDDLDMGTGSITTTNITVDTKATINNAAITGGTNTFDITNGTASLNVAAGSVLDVNANLTVEAASAINQDVTSDATPTFANIIDSGLTASQIVETNGSKQLISAAKGTAYNQAFETSTANIKMDGSVSVGSSSNIAHSDHVHPTDTSRAADSAVVHNTGNESVAGVKTFTDNPIVSNAAPAHTLTNTTAEDTDGGRESYRVAKGTQSGSEVTTLGKDGFSHDGALDDQKGKFTRYLNSGTDDDAPAKQMLEQSSDGQSVIGDPADDGIVDVPDSTGTSQAKLNSVGDGYHMNYWGIGTKTPNTQSDIQGGQTVKITEIDAATYDLLISDYILHVTYTATAAVTSLTLTSAQCVAGRVIVVKDAGGGAGANNITIDTEGAETIDGAATLVISTNYDKVTLYSDGSDWFVI